MRAFRFRGFWRRPYLSWEIWRDVASRAFCSIAVGCDDEDDDDHDDHDDDDNDNGDGDEDDDDDVAQRNVYLVVTLCCEKSFS